MEQRDGVHDGGQSLKIAKTMDEEQKKIIKEDSNIGSLSNWMNAQPFRYREPWRLWRVRVRSSSEGTAIISSERGRLHSL